MKLKPMNHTTKEDKREQILSAANTARWDLGMDFHDAVIESIYADASRIARKTVRQEGEKAAYALDVKIDKIVTSRWLGFPMMFLMLAVVFWLTIAGANYPSTMLASFLIDYLHRQRVKIWGVATATDDPARLAALTPAAYDARVEQAIVITVSAWDANCPQHIPQLVEAADMAARLAESEARIAALEAALAAARRPR